MSKQPDASKSQNQGEGNRTADREYRDGATQHAKTDKSKEKAREAEQAVDSGEKASLEHAEQVGKAPARS